MALVSKLSKIGFGSREAKALGFATERLVASGDAAGVGAAQINEAIVIVTGGTATTGVRLPTYDQSKSGIHHVVNVDLVNGFLIFPASGEQINELGANTPITLSPGSHAVIYLGEEVAGPGWWGFYGFTLS